MTAPAITEHALTTARHTSFYLACGPADATPLIFLHGWPELAISWRHQLPVFGALGFRAIAPDLRGYGRSSIYTRHQDYAVAETVADMLELLDALGRECAIWVGHDWGSPVVWSLASHHSERCLGVANLCVPHLPAGFSLPNLTALVDRALYPEAEYPYGQWDYMRFYEENFAAAQAEMEADVTATLKILFRRGNPAMRGAPARTALVRRNGGWFGAAGRAPVVPLDTGVLSEEELRAYAAALTRNGFFGPNSWYMNHEANRDYAQSAPRDGRLALPVLFLHAAHDTTCDTTGSPLAEPMRGACADLTEIVVRSGHWMAQERPVAVNAALAKWLAVALPETWAA
jgi:pimeloyl-ACP methyl ester carboxylesterase